MSVRAQVLRAFMLPCLAACGSTVAFEPGDAFEPVDAVEPTAMAATLPFEELGSDAPPGAGRWLFALVVPSGERLGLVGQPVGRGGYDVRELPVNGFASDLNVVTRTLSRHGDFLAFEFTAPGTDHWRIAYATRSGDAYRVVATSEHEAVWADWAVVSPDGKRVAAWVLADEYPLHVMRVDDDRLVVVERHFEGAAKVFPRFAPDGRIAVRMPLEGEPLRYANAIDGVVGERLREVREVEFDRTGARWAYAGLRTDGWYVFTPKGAFGPFERIGELELDGPEAVRAHVQRDGAWSWVAPAAPR